MPNLAQTELHLCRSSRLGIRKTGRNVGTSDWQLFSNDPMPGTGGVCTGEWTRRNVLFELSNHLGNVLVTISDHKLLVPAHTESCGASCTVLVPAHFEAEVVTANDYYPFGMGMPGRKFSATGLYRYGFNGKENENDVKGEGNQQDYGMRIYDPRLGRFLSVDPLTMSYPWYTPYQFAGNKPIACIDLDGLEEDWKVKTDYRIQYKPVVNTPNVGTAVNNSAHNAMSFVWNSTAGTVLEAGKSVWNTVAETVSGNYKPADWEVDPVGSFNRWMGDWWEYLTETPIKQHINNFADAATNLETYELPFQLLLGHTVAGNTVKVTGSTATETSIRVRLVSSAEANAEHAKKGWHAPYQVGTTLAEFETPSKLENLVRLSGPKNIEGDWFTTMDEIKGLTPAQLKDKFALKYEPVYATPATMAQGSTIRVGTAAPIKEYGANGGGFQIELRQGEVQYGAPQIIKNP